MFKLFHNERESKLIEQELEKKQADLARIEQKRSGQDELLREKKKESGKVARELGKIEQTLHEWVCNIYFKKCCTFYLNVRLFVFYYFCSYYCIY